jgi:CDP-paratose 2-epimerase
VSALAGNVQGAQWRPRTGPVLITGGIGFIGTNLAIRLLAASQPVVVLDNLSRRGVAENLSYLQRIGDGALAVQIADIRDYKAVERAAADAVAVFHLAAQVAVTSSLICPREDFTVNAEGTLNLLEVLRRRPDPPPLLFTSTNKVYGAMSELPLGEGPFSYAPTDPVVRHNGLSEATPLNFHSPYGCSKGCAEQYVLDYSQTYGLRSTVFRMSCIYGPFQRGNEDQGWVAHFAAALLRGDPIRIYGNGKQVRDLLFVDDLIDAMFLALNNIEEASGRAFNIGGGPANALSVLEVIALLGELQGVAPAILFDQWRRADQRYYVSDTSRFQKLTRWSPKTRPRQGIRKLCEWLSSHSVHITSPTARAHAESLR